MVKGGKSYVSCNWIALSCIQFEGIRAVLARLTLKSLRESTLNTFWSVLKSWGLKEDENYKYDSIKGVIEFWNGSTVTLLEMADMPSDPDFQRFGSSEYTIAFVDEAGEVCEKSVDILSSRLRWKIHETFKVPKLLMSCNPSTNFLRERFVCDADGNPAKLNKYEYYVPFRVTDNPDEKFRMVYEAKLRTIKDPATRERLYYGNWLYVSQNDLAYYDGFNGDVHVVEKLKEQEYSPDLPLILSFDFNVAPYMTCEVLQIDFTNKRINFIEEFIGTPQSKTNNSPKFSKYIQQRPSIKFHDGGLLITGDPSGKASSTKVEEDVNDYSIIQSNLKPLRTSLKLMAKQPPQVTRGEWINRVLYEEYDGWAIRIDSRCRRLIDDLTLQKKDSTGGKEKKKVHDNKLGVKVEKYGHASDCFDYALCTFLHESWSKYKRGNKEKTSVTTVPIRTAWQE
ncbi:MAG: phage terminase large subunit [Bacteroidales bacterium]